MRPLRILFVLLVGCTILPDPGAAAVLEERIVFASDRDGDYDVYAMDTDGSNVVQLTNDPAADFAPSISPDGTRIAFIRASFLGYEGDVMLMNADGSGQASIQPPDRAGLDPDWSPGGAQIVFGTEGHGAPEGLWVINSDGTNLHGVALVDNSDIEPSWSPDNAKIAFAVESNTLQDGIWTVAPDGTGLTRITITDPDFPNNNPDWRFDSAKIAFDRPGGLAVMNPDGSGMQGVGVAGADPSWSPDGTRFAFVKNFAAPTPGQVYSEIHRVNVDGTAETPVTNDAADAIDPDWGRISNVIGPGYPRPKGASPLRVSLVPASEQCTSPNSTHGAPLSFGSCAPPQARSVYLTTGTPDANGLGARMGAYLLLRALPGDASTEADEADVSIDVHVNDVFTSDIADYGGELRTSVPVAITDRDNLPPVGGPGPGTAQPFAFGFDVPCVGTAALGTGSDCSLATTVDTLVPGAIKETRRTIWQVGQVRVFDGGADGDGATTADNTVFLTQGVFIP